MHCAVWNYFIFVCSVYSDFNADKTVPLVDILLVVCRMFDDVEDGYLTTKEMSDILTRLGDSLSKAEMHQMIRQARWVAPGGGRKRGQGC